MIRQLVRRDLAWKATPWCAVLCAVVWGWPSKIEGFGGFIAVMGLFVGQPNRHATRFEAALPISARDVLLSRAYSLLALIWIPAIGGAAAVLAAKGVCLDAAKPFAVGGLSMLCAGVGQWVRRERLVNSMWLVWPFFPLATGVGNSIEELWARIIVVLCGVMGAVLLAATPAFAPPSFQIAPAGPKGEATEVEWQESDRSLTVAARRLSSWAPLVRSAYSWRIAIFLVMMLFQAGSGQWPTNVLWLAFVWAISRFSEAVPLNTPALMAALVAVLVGLYFLLEKVYSEPDFADRPKAQLADA